MPPLKSVLIGLVCGFASGSAIGTVITIWDAKPLQPPPSAALLNEFDLYNSACKLRKERCGADQQ